MPLNNRSASEVIDYVTRQFGDDAGVQITEEDMIRWINQAQVEITKTNEVLRASATSSTVNGQESYDMPADCLKITSVKVNSHVLKRVGFDRYQQLFQDDNGPACSEYWTMYSDQIMIGGAPDADGDTITIYYIPEPSQITGPSTTLAVPDAYFDRVCEYVMSKAYELDEDWSAHAVQRQLFEDKLNQESFADEDSRGPMPVVIDVYGYSEGW